MSTVLQGIQLHLSSFIHTAWQILWKSGSEQVSVLWKFEYLGYGSWSSQHLAHAVYLIKFSWYLIWTLWNTITFHFFVLILFNLLKFLLNWTYDRLFESLHSVLKIACELAKNAPNLHLKSLSQALCSSRHVPEWRGASPMSNSYLGWCEGLENYENGVHNDSWSMTGTDVRVRPVQIGISMCIAHPSHHQTSQARHTSCTGT